MNETMYDSGWLINQLKPKENGFEQVSPLLDTKCGFTAVKKLETKNTAAHYYSFITVFLEEVGRGKQRLVVRVGLVQKKEKENDFYVFSNRKGKQKYLPIDIVSRDDYFYNTEKEVFCDKKNEKVVGENILAKVYKQHTDTSKTILSRYLWAKIWVIRAPAVIAKVVQKAAYYTLLLVAGEKCSYSIFGEIVQIKQVFKESETKKSEFLAKSFSFFGYPASFWSIMSYATLHLVVYLILYLFSIRPKVLEIVLTNSFLTAAYTVLSLGVYEVVLPSFLRWVIKRASVAHFRISTKEIRI